MRLPKLLSGMGLVVVPLLLRRETTLPVRAAWVALLAISPLLVYHSKTARPYALTSLLTFIAIVAFRCWWLREGATKGWGAAYIAATFLAGWLHPITLAFTLLPFPAFYHELAQKPPRTLTLIEAPWRLESNFNPHPWYQEIHRQYVKIGLVTPVCGVREFGEYPATVTALRFREFVHLNMILVGKSYGTDYLIMHLKPWKTPPDAEVEWPDVETCLPEIEAKVGAPVYRDEQIVVFDLKVNRRP